MSHSIAEIAKALGVTALGRTDLIVTGAAEPSMAGPDDLALALSPDFADGLANGRARAAVVWPGADWQALGLEAAIEANRGRLAMSRLSHMLDPDDVFRTGHHSSAVIDPSARIADDVWIGPFVEIGSDVVIGAGTRIAGRVTIGAKTRIGQDCRVHPGVTIQPRVRIGNRVVLQPGAVIGADGFSFVTETPSHAETMRRTAGLRPLVKPDGPTDWHKIASLGAVDIGDDVEVGANSTIDAGTIRATQIGQGTKIDNLVQIGHNCIIGRDCMICGMAGLAGSVEVGDRVILAGRSAAADHIRIGSDVVAAGGAKMTKDVESGQVVFGYPAMPMTEHRAQTRALRQLSRKPVPKSGDRD